MRRYWVAGILAVGLLGAGIGVAPGAGARPRHRRDPVDASGPLDLARVGVEQVRRDLELDIRTRGKFGLDEINRRPNLSNRNARFLCLRIQRSGGSLTRVLCFGDAANGDHDTLGYGKLAPDGSLRSWKAIHASVKRRNSSTVRARFRPAEADLRPHRYRWRMVSQWSGPQCEAPGGGPLPLPKRRARHSRRPKAGPGRCFDQAPDHRKARLRIRAVQPVGCTDPGPSPVFGGSRRHKRVALTFDDGPSVYTPRVLHVLKREHAKATFFEIGEQVPGLAANSRAVLASGDELGNHSLHHESHPSRASMAETNRRIKAATGFEPCLFRPPGGAFDSRVVADAHRLGMTTVIWNVDPRDWSRPGTNAIYSRVVSATRPGSIVIMHDGGGNRSETVAALPRIIHTLRHRGYSFVTVTKLLHGRMIWGPVR
ncbi:MAG TPA: polysaccharide deacetylase family protein [Solirubrobacterales bacterium]|nr:polysaccharide deacetylase family protein [Solirubrobacterales bacterium]